jgi:hypothetical protein
MPLQLPELQARVAQAVLTADAEVLAPLLRGDLAACTRFRIHTRNYEASLTEAISNKYPATAWLIGEQRFNVAARAYVHAEPPRKPCIAEYGATFSAFLERSDHSFSVPYLGAFAALEWSVGQVSVATAAQPMVWDDVAATGSEALLDSALELQPGIRYLRAAWAVEELFNVYWRGVEVDRFVLPQRATYIEVRGCRGEFWVTTIAPAAFEFRSALAAGRSVGNAAAAALDGDAMFDAGTALREVIAANLAIGILPVASGGEP